MNPTPPRNLASLIAQTTPKAALHVLSDGGKEFERVEIFSLAADSRKVERGALFAALKGEAADGLDFLEEALARGAAALVVPVASGARARAMAPSTLPILTAADPRRALALLAAQLFPNQPEIIVAVTGTAGKTSVASFAQQIFAHLGHRAASLGTLGLVAGGESGEPGLTTPDPVSLHRILDRLAADGTTHLALEASSHGLDQRRLDGVRLSAAAFTNLGHDHFDYHGTVDEYFMAKARLWGEVLPPGAPLVVDADAPFADRAAAQARSARRPVLDIGRTGQFLRCVAIHATTNGQRLDLETPSGRRRIYLPLLGRFQVSNALVAAALAMAVGESEAAALGALEVLRGAPGRLERVDRDQGPRVFVDYAHKPEALKAALMALRPLTARRLICVFGCGGDRDAAKRPLMGAIAARLADRVIVTDDNPRSEDPAAIRQAVLAAAPAAEEIGDRAAAIHHAIASAGFGDVVCIAGKGHETGQTAHGRTCPFDDRDMARAALADLQRKAAGHG